MTSLILMDIIKYVADSGKYDVIMKLQHVVGFHVFAMVSDLGGSNRGLHSELNVSENKPYFENSTNKEKIFMFADVPHLLKLIRNNSVDHGFIIKEKLIKADIVEQAMQETSTPDFKTTHKLTLDQLHIAGPQRQRSIANKIIVPPLLSPQQRTASTSVADYVASKLETIDNDDIWEEIVEEIMSVLHRGLKKFRASKKAMTSSKDTLTMLFLPDRATFKRGMEFHYFEGEAPLLTPSFKPRYTRVAAVPEESPSTSVELSHCIISNCQRIQKNTPADVREQLAEFTSTPSLELANYQQ
nr:unnamed protein product [Callosobruchus analis]